MIQRLFCLLQCHAWTFDWPSSCDERECHRCRLREFWADGTWMQIDNRLIDTPQR